MDVTSGSGTGANLSSADPAVELYQQFIYIPSHKNRCSSENTL